MSKNYDSFPNYDPKSPIKGKLPYADFMWVFPDAAKYVLTHKKHRNRTVKAVAAQRYGNMVRRDEWYPTGQGVSFNHEGNLLDGQNRFEAIVLADKPALLLIAFNIPTKAQLVMDQGVFRSAHDQIKIQHGWDVAAVQIGICKQMMLSFDSANRSDLTDILIVDKFYRRHHAAIEFSFECLRGRGQEKGVTIAPVMGPIARAFYTQDHHRLKRFGEVLLDGLANNQGEHAAVVLRNWLQRGVKKGLSSRRSGQRQLIYKKTATALHYFLIKKHLTKMPPDLTEEPFQLPREPKIVKQLSRAAAAGANASL